MQVAAIVPARNEAARIAETIAALRRIDVIGEVIVVDDASEDATSVAAAGAGALVIRLERRHGKGGALAAGASRTSAPVLVFIDGDLGETASIARVLLAPVLSGDADMAVAAPPRAGGPSGFGFVEAVSRWGVRHLGGPALARPLCGQRALRRPVLERARLAPRFGVEVGLAIDAARAGFTIVEVPCSFVHARTGRDLRGFAHRARQGLDIAAVLGIRALRRGA